MCDVFVCVLYMSVCVIVTAFAMCAENPLLNFCFNAAVLSFYPIDFLAISYPHTILGFLRGASAFFFFLLLII